MKLGWDSESEAVGRGLGIPGGSGQSLGNRNKYEYWYSIISLQLQTRLKNKAERQGDQKINMLIISFLLILQKHLTPIFLTTEFYLQLPT